MSSFPHLQLPKVLHAGPLCIKSGIRFRELKTFLVQNAGPVKRHAMIIAEQEGRPYGTFMKRLGKRILPNRACAGVGLQKHNPRISMEKMQVEPNKLMVGEIYCILVESRDFKLPK